VAILRDGDNPDHIPRLPIAGIKKPNSRGFGSKRALNREELKVTRS
jgi:hypothetical protein